MKTALILVIFIVLLGCETYGVPECADPTPIDEAPTQAQSEICSCTYDQIDAGAGCEGCQEASVCVAAENDAGVFVPACVAVWQ